MRRLLLGNHGKMVVVSALALCVGLASWVIVLAEGMLKTAGMGNSFCWGLLITLFAFLVGFGAGGQLVASYTVLSRRQELQAWAVPAQAVALGGAVGAAVAIIADLGSPGNIMAMMLHPNPTSALTWDMLALTAFIAVAVVCHVALVCSWKSRRAWMWVGVATAVALQVVEGLLFALQGARAWWHSIVVPVDFLVVAAVCGLSLLVLLSALSSRDGTLDASRSFARLLVVAVAVHLVFALLDVVLLAADATAASDMTLDLLSRYAALYATELVLPLGAAVVLGIRRTGTGKPVLVGCSLAVIVGMFAHRMMLLYPALAAPTLFLSLSNVPSSSWAYPISTGLYGNTGVAFQIIQGYVPTAFEVGTALLPLGCAALIAVVGVNVARGLERCH